MKKLILLLLSIFFVGFCFGQLVNEYKSLDTKNLIIFGGDNIVYKGKNIKLGPKAFFIDGQLSDEEAAKYSYVFNSVNEASKHLTDGTEKSPMVLYIAPYVYWLDDPDDPAIRIPKPGGKTFLGLEIPFALEIKCEWLRFYGLSDDARNVVLACNRGQSMGAKGNFTLLNISGQGTSAENITFGNYCNIDLEYPLRPELSRKKRGSTVVQAMLIICDGDKIMAHNTRFISRLDLFPFVGGKRVLFDHCHFESTDDSLNPTAVYLNCTFEFYSGRPFFETSGTGAVLLDCDVKSFTRGKQYFSKFGGQLAVVDTRFKSETLTYLGWKDFPVKETRNYQYNVLLNEEPYLIDNQNCKLTVDMAGKTVLDAYRFIYDGAVVYNTYNLLRGNDDWDPMGIRGLVLSAENESGKSYINIGTQLSILSTKDTNKSEKSHFDPTTQLLILPTRDTIETGKGSIVLYAQEKKFGNYRVKCGLVKWSVAPEYQSFVDLRVEDDSTCKVIPTNKSDKIKEVTITATTPTGLESAYVINVLPQILDAPKFKSPPKIVNRNDGKLFINYKLDTRFKDESLISWYRCSDVKGNNPIEILVSRFNKPKLEYQLSAGDIGYYIMATVVPKHIKSNIGRVVYAVTDNPVSAKDVKVENNLLKVDIKSMSTKYQPKIIPGFWTFDYHIPADKAGTNKIIDSKGNPWYYGTGIDGAANDTGLVQANSWARLIYTPVGQEFGDMKFTFTAVPAKTAGQGFSTSNEFMDIYIKFDTKTLNGYALRLIRTIKYHDAIDFILMKYENGIAVAISEPVSTNCYRPRCNITLEVVDGKFFVHAESPTGHDIVDKRPEVVQVVDLETGIIPNKFGGIGFQYTRGIGSGATLIKDLKIEWK